MGDFPQKGGFATNDSDIKLENDCFQILNNYSNLSLKVKKFQKIIMELEKEKSKLSINVKDFENSVNFLKEENSKLSLKNEIFEKEIFSLRQNLSESDEKFESQRDDFMEKLSISQCNFFDSDNHKKSLELKVKELTCELEKYKNISMNFTNGSQCLDKLLGIGKTFGDRKGLGFDNNIHASSLTKTVFVKPTNVFEKSNVSQGNTSFKETNLQNPRLNHVETNRKNLSSSQVLNKKFIPVCHFCGAKGHIRPKCYKLLNDKSNFHINVSNKFDVLMKEIVRTNKGVNKKFRDNFINSNKLARKKVWIKKSDFKCNIAHDNMNDHKSKLWYLDSACASHMSSEKSYFENLKSCDDCSVIFGDGSSPKIFEKERVKTFKNHLSYQKFVPKCHHCGEIGHIRPRCQKFLKGKISFEKNIFEKCDELTKEISKLKNGTVWKPSLNTVNEGKSVKKVWAKKEALKGNTKDTVFDFSKVRILKRPNNSSKLN